MNKKKVMRVVFGVVFFLVSGSMYLMYNQPEGDSLVVTEDFQDEEKMLDSAPEKTESEAVWLHVCGEVKKPGVYRFAKVPRVIDAINKAGGFTKRAQQDCINLAQVMEDGQQLVVEAIQKEKKEKKRAEKTASSNTNMNKVNINDASKEELMTLKGIGEAKAEQILSYRKTNGNFSKIEDIMMITGIKEGVFSQIKDNIMV